MAGPTDKDVIEALADTAEFAAAEIRVLLDSGKLGVGSRAGRLEEATRRLEAGSILVRRIAREMQS